MINAEPTITMRRPDVNSAEAIVYGDEYLMQKSADWFWDAVEDELRKQLEKNKAAVRDKEFAAMVLKNRPNMIFARNPPVSDFDQLKDLRTLKMCVRNASALKDLEIRRKNNEMYSRMKGIAQYTRQMYDSGIADGTWKISISGRDEPITFDAIRRLMDDDEMKADENALEYAIELDEYKADRERFSQELEAYRKAMEEGTEFIPPEFDQDESLDGSFDDMDDTLSQIPIYKEVLERGSQAEDEEEADDGIPDPNSEGFWQNGCDDDEDAYSDVGGYSTPSLKDYDFVNASMHNAIRSHIRWWSADDIEWFLTEVVA